ncbi:hypothetical protein SAMN05216404_103139 [Nitrosospira multiformis]|uniref:Uncharacterized protein n=1 Tax=Nitrosospira multiformis TaxID=1231 RepID=A0A1H8EUK4_9PROT|nr:hypothetical protein [Nitrosospira multiformis]SEN22587.1 hypothetical protein SAMN05216404_103139 [Nitrosospira multiformis]
MFSNSDLLVSLAELDRKYEEKRDPRYAKYALLELCGWIEEAQDHVMRACASKLTLDSFKKYVEEEIKRNSGFDINRNFYPLLSLIIGMRHFEQILVKLRSSGMYFLPFESAVKSLKPHRHTHAHTHYVENNSEKMLYISTASPSVITQQARQIFFGLEELEAELKIVDFL